MLKLHPSFSDHMVIQRGVPITITGMGVSGGVVTVRLADFELSATVDESGAWGVTFDAMPAGGPWEVLVWCGRKTVRVSDVWIGDVWICSGQSNMDWKVRQCLPGEQESARKNASNNIRLLTIPKAGVDAPLATFEAKWEVGTQEAVAAFSAVATFFAQHLRTFHGGSGVKIGLIDSSYGGTEVEAWMSPEILEREFADEGLRPSIFDFKPSAMYNAMIAPLLPLRARGVLWYQGESNANRPGQYARLLAGLIRDWRRAFASAELPFFIVQLPNYAFPLVGYPFTWLREDQATVASTTPGVYLAVTIDAEDGHDLHPHEKREIGRRLALLAARHCLGEDIVASGPVYTGHTTADGVMRVHFTNATGLATQGGGPVKGFALEDARGAYLYVPGSIEGDSVCLQNAGNARSIRYAWEGDPEVNLVNGAGLPAAPFRTDAYPPSPHEIAQLPAPFEFVVGEIIVTIDGAGSLHSLLAHGVEFLRVAPPLARGGVYYYQYELYGAMQLFRATKAGPRVVAAENFSASARYVFEDEGLRCVLGNKGTESIFYRIALQNDVEGEMEADAFIAKREGSMLRFEGVDRLRRHPQLGAVLEVEVKPAQFREVTVRVQ